MHNSLNLLNLENKNNNIFTNLSPKIKMLIILLIIFTSSLLNNILLLVLLLFYVILLILISKVSLVYVLKRIIIILPFGFFLALFQLFTKEGAVIYNIFGLPIYYEGVVFGTMLFLKFLISISCIIFLTTTTSTYEVIIGCRKLGMPPIIATMLGLMIRYLFIMFEILDNIITSQKSRGLNRKNIKYNEILNIFGYSVGSIFIKSYDQGEKTYWSMLSRGYSKDSNVDEYYDDKIKNKDKLLLGATIFYISILIILNLLHYLEYININNIFNIFVSIC